MGKRKGLPPAPTEIELWLYDEPTMLAEVERLRVRYYDPEALLVAMIDALCHYIKPGSPASWVRDEAANRVWAFLARAYGSLDEVFETDVSRAHERTADQRRRRHQQWEVISAVVEHRRKGVLADEAKLLVAKQFKISLKTLNTLYANERLRKTIENLPPLRFMPRQPLTFRTK